jgi:hypothetical protein
MWKFVRTLFSKSKTLNAALGDVVFETPSVTGQSPRSFLQWRVKRDLDRGAYFIGLSMLPDAYIGPEGSPTNYMNFDIQSAQRLRFQLDRCIDEYYSLTGQIPRHAANPTLPME